MFIPVEKSKDKTANLKKLVETLPYYINAGDPWYTTLSNAAAVLEYFMDDVNWIGFYIMEKDALYLGPFQGKAACTKILLGSGVCGHAALEKKIVKVDDVNTFEGHITCDSDSQSELVVPIVKNGALFGVLDIDAPIKSRFNDEDVHAMEQVVKIIVDNLE